MLFRGDFSESRKRLLERRCTEYLTVCNTHGLSNLPLKGQNSIDISESGEYILATNRAFFCLIDTKSQLNKREPPGRGIFESQKICCCESKENKRLTNITENTILCRPLTYKSRCTSSLWYSLDNSIFLTAGDCLVDVWDVSVPEIAYTFRNLPTAVKHIAVSGRTRTNPLIAAGMACGSISICDMRCGTVFAYCKPLDSGDVTTIKFLPYTDNLLIGGYINGSVLIWDLRRYNKPLHSLHRDDAHRRDSSIQGCSIAVGHIGVAMKPRELKENHCHGFANEDEIWNYIFGYSNPDISKADFDKNKLSSSLEYNEKSIAKGVNTCNRRYKTLVKSFKSNSGRSYLRKRNIDIPSSAAVIFETKRLSNNNLNSVQNQQYGFPTDVQFTSDNFKLYISRFKGHIECYDAKNFRFFESIDVNQFSWGHEDGKYTRNTYSQRMYINLACEGAYIIFNAKDSLGIIDARTNVCKRLVKLQWHEPSSMIDQYSSNEYAEALPNRSYDAAFMERLEPTERYVTSFAMVPLRRDIYVTNESGQLFYIHPDYSKILKSHPTTF